MKETLRSGLTISLFSVLLLLSCTHNNRKAFESTKRPYAQMGEINWYDVTLTQGFWFDKLMLCREKIIPAVYYGLKHPDNSEHIDNLAIAAGIKEGKFTGLDFSDGDSYKWLESLAYMYGLTRDAAIDSTLDYWIGMIQKAQMPDGYLSSNMQLKGLARYSPATQGRHDGGYHEMYNFGHLITAACVHYRATEKTSFLEVARKLGDLLSIDMTEAGPARVVTVGNLPTIMALVDLYRVTGEKKYLEAAEVGINVRGTYEDKTDFTQDHFPFRNETEAVGHAVFATYLYAGAADVYMETGEKALLDALKRIWDNADNRRTYITGGVGALPHGVSARGDIVNEAFGADFQLCNAQAYNETCANTGNAMWNWRMFLLTGEEKYMERVERVIYNSMLSGVSLSGDHFFYSNPLEWNQGSDTVSINHTAQRWQTHTCYCCPSQIARTIAGIGRWFYTVSENKLWLNLYGGNQLETVVPAAGTVKLNQVTNYPWDGHIRIELLEVPGNPFTLALRIPSWTTKPSVRVNSVVQPFDPIPGTFFDLEKEWKKGDVIEIELPLSAKIMEADSRVSDCREKVAVMYGPMVYCAESSPLMEGVASGEDSFFLSKASVFEPIEGSGVLSGITLLRTKAYSKLPENAMPVTSINTGDTLQNTRLYRLVSFSEDSVATPGNLDVELIPYYAWANRGERRMKVWIPSF
jgi:DUF1680 family protein